MTTGSLTVLFEDPFWIGLFEMIDQNGLRACKVTFGAEPTEKEVMEFVDKNWHRLQFSQAIEVSAESERAKVILKDNFVKPKSKCNHKASAPSLNRL